ncbi:Trp biosynthesis-associated membrane protein [Actinotalea sp. BY-33]|uniref:Trp biosynthesis-associated membrane protein n=1 Tax=Actinotalea soli TaxID=2819234 RepID=A0A939LPS0_9CELL|nr:Trp biosynthesis-associated membrane protein [Actinotalea soli]MBO1750270.1 Trp biosynthesis-associated membrane protein [Actinotalea soli]
MTWLPRRRAVLLGLVLGAATAIAGSVAWVRAVTTSAVEAEVALTVPGSVAAPGVAAAGFVLLAAALAVALAGRWGVRLGGTVMVLAGVLTVVSTLGVLTDPSGVAASAAQEAVGVAAAGQVTTTAAPWAAIALALAAGALGVLTTVSSSSWDRPRSRHEPARAAPARERAAEGAVESTADSHPRDDDLAAWDALSEGRDPT